MSCTLESNKTKKTLVESISCTLFVTCQMKKNCIIFRCKFPVTQSMRTEETMVNVTYFNFIYD